MNDAAHPAAARITNLAAEATVAWTKRWCRDSLTVAEFNQAYSALADAAAEQGYTNKLFGTLAFGDQEISFRIDVDGDKSEGLDLLSVMRGRVRFYESAKGREFVRMYRKGQDPAPTYRAAVEALSR